MQAADRFQHFQMMDRALAAYDRAIALYDDPDAAPYLFKKFFHIPINRKMLLKVFPCITPPQCLYKVI